MNIINVGDSQNLGQTNPDTNISPAVEKPVRLEQPVEKSDEYVRQVLSDQENAAISRVDRLEQREQPAEHRDEYVQTVEVAKDAVYNVSDVNSGKQSKRYYSDTESVKIKVVDMLLPMGKKNLSIFVEED